MSRKTHALALAAALSAPALMAQTHCPDLARFEVGGITMHDTTLDVAVDRLLAGTPWVAEYVGPVDAVRVSLDGVSGPMDLVMDDLIRGASASPAVSSVSAMRDSSACLMRVEVTPLRPAAPQGASMLPDLGLASADPIPVPMPGVIDAKDQGPGHRTHVLPGGRKLSQALSEYVALHGWTLRWRIEDDFLIDTDIPIPPGDVIDGVLHVVRAYQSAGAMRTVRPRFAEPNRVVVIETTGDQL